MLNRKFHRNIIEGFRITKDIYLYMPNHATLLSRQKGKNEAILWVTLLGKHHDSTVLLYCMIGVY